MSAAGITLISFQSHRMHSSHAHVAGEVPTNLAQKGCILGNWILNAVSNVHGCHTEAMLAIRPNLNLRELPSPETDR